MKNLDRGGGDAEVHLPTCQLVRNAVEVAFRRHVIIELDLQTAPVTDLETIGRKRPQRRLIERFEQAGPRAFTLAEWSVIEPRQQLGDGFVELWEAEECAF